MTLKEIGMFPISNYISGIIPGKFFDTTTKQKKERFRAVVKDLVNTLNYFWKQHRIPYRVRDIRRGDKPRGLKETETKRDYKKEYKKFQSSKKAKKYRAELNKYNRQKGTYGNGDGKDASHKGGKIVGFEKESKNRGRAEKSRLKKEFLSSINPIIDEAVDGLVLEGVDDPGIFKAIFLAGGPGSGKTFVAQKLFGIPDRLTTSAKGLKLVNQDTEFEMLLKKYFGVLSYQELNQTHSTNILGIDVKENNEFDGFLSNESKVAFAIKTADCIPLLLWDEEKKYDPGTNGQFRTTKLYKFCKLVIPEG